MQSKKLKKERRVEEIEKSVKLMLKHKDKMQDSALDQNWELFRKEHKKMLKEALKLKKLLSKDNL